jgi:IS4 transposase
LNKKLLDRCELIGERILSANSAVIQRFSHGYKEIKGASRFFNNESFNWMDLGERLKDKCRQQCPASHILLLEDTTELNYASKSGKLADDDPEMGVLSDNHTLGFHLHPGLAVEAETGIPVGIAHVSVWNRPASIPGRPPGQHKKKPIEEKESYRWLETAAKGADCLEKATRVTVIGDRESDIYEQFCRVPNERVDLLIRSSYNRKLTNGKLLFDHLSSMPVAGHKILKIKGKPGVKSRQATLEIRFAKVSIAAPKNRKVSEQDPESVEMYVVEAKEPSDKKNAICWRILTSHPVDTLEQALQVIEWYACRWWIEELFRLMKSQGLDVESSQLESGQALKKLAVSCLEAAYRILLLRQERDGKAGLKADRLFSEQEIQCMEAVIPTYEGKTQRQKNPHPPHSMAWAAWLIARLGGWMGYSKSESPPGVITLKRGLSSFNQLFKGWITAVNALKNEH